MTEVICYGSLIPDRVLQLPRFPHPGEGVHALSERLYLGGEPCNVGGHLAAWGVEVAIAGNNLGDDALGQFVSERLARRPRTRVASRRDVAVQTPTCYIWTTPDGERTIVPSWPTPTGWTLPDTNLLREARIVSASIFGPGMAEMLTLARSWRLPIAVADVAGPDDERLPGAVIVTTSVAVLQRRYHVAEPRAWQQAVHAATGALVVVSAGPNAVHALTPDGRWLRAQPPSIAPVDTTGAGDALKAGLLLGWLRGWSIEAGLCWGIAAASLQCRHAGACEEVPNEREIEALAREVRVEE